MEAAGILGKTVLVGLTYVDANGSIREREQWHGVVIAVDDDGVTVRRPSGEISTLPPTLESFTKAEPGDYTLRGTGEVVSNPDLLCTWTITEPSHPAAAGDGDLSDAEWVELYEQRRDVYEAFANRLRDLLDTLHEQEGLYPWVITFSTSGWSLAQALSRARRERFDNPLESHVRVAGLEVGVDTRLEAEEIEEVITRELVVDPAGSRLLDEVTAQREEHGLELAYEYPYYLVSLDERRLELPEWSRFAGVKLRIEVKTELQHAWESSFEGLPFPVAAAYPPEAADLLTRARRAVAEADADVDEAKQLISRFTTTYEEAVAAGDLDLPLNGLSLFAFLRSSPLLRSLCEVGQDVGLRYEEDYEPNWGDVERNLWVLQAGGVETVAEIEEFLERAEARAPGILTELARVAGERGFVPWAFPEAILEWLWLVLHRADAETVSLAWYTEELEYALNALIGNPVPPPEQ